MPLSVKPGDGGSVTTGKERLVLSRNSSLLLCLAGFLLTFWFNVYQLRILHLPNIYRHEVAKVPGKNSAQAQRQHALTESVTFDSELYKHENTGYSETIYGIMITGKDSIHCRLAEESILSFKEQTYPSKVLYIVEDGDYSFRSLKFAPNSSKFDGLSIRIIDARPKSQNEEKLKLGDLRNLALDTLQADLKLAASDKENFNFSNAIWVQWDDDDFHHPEFLSRMYTELVLNRADAVVLREQVMHAWGPKLNWGDTKDQVSINPKGILGTIMARGTAVRYPGRAIKGEDASFFRKLKSSSKIVIWNNTQIPHIYVRFVHGANTWQRTHFGNTKYSFQRPTPPESKAFLEHILERYAFVQPWRKNPDTLQCHF